MNNKKGLSLRCALLRVANTLTYQVSFLSIFKTFHQRYFRKALAKVDDGVLQLSTAAGRSAATTSEVVVHFCGVAHPKVSKIFLAAARADLLV